MNGFNKSGTAGVMKAVLKGILFFGICVLLFSAAFYLFAVNEDYIPIFVSGLLFLTAFLTGIWSSSGKSTKGYLRGLFAGGALVTLFMVFSSFYGGRPINQAVLTYFIMLVISVAGGIIGVNLN